MDLNQTEMRERIRTKAPPKPIEEAPFTLHIVSETPFVMKGNGVHTAFVDHVALMKETSDIRVVVNGEGEGDVFHAHTYGPYYFWKGRKYKGRRVYTVHVTPDSIKGSLPAWKIWFPLVKWYFKRVYQYADVCIAISPMVERAIRSTGAHTRIERVYNPVPLEFWKRTQEKRRIGREMLGISRREKLVLGVGQLEGRKGVEDFLEAAVALPDATFVWVGGRPFGVLTEGIRRLNLKISRAPRNIRFPGMKELDQMPYIYAAADILLFPSLQENCPLVPLEAAASGIPVIFRDLPEYRLLYDHPYLKSENVDGYIALLRRLMDDPGFYETGIQISLQLLTQFDKDLIRKKLMDIYTQLYNQSKLQMPF